MSAIPQERQLEGQVAIVTGAAGGIGRAIVEAFAAEGASIAVADMAESATAELVEYLQDAGRSATSIPTDVTDTSQVQELVARTADEFGRVDIVINNAGVFQLGGILDTDVDAWRRVFAVNVDGCYSLSREALAVMLTQEPHPASGCRGRIINVSSAAAEVGRPFLPAYGASKSALNHLSKTLAAAFADQLICTTVLYPGNVREGMWRDIGPLLAALENRPVEEVLAERRFQRPEEVAAAAVFIARATGMGLNGQIVASEPEARPL